MQDGLWFTYGEVNRLSGWLSGKKSTFNTGDESSILGLGRFPGGGNGNPLQYSCLGNPMDRGAWWITVHGVTNSPWGQLQSVTQTMVRPTDQETLPLKRQLLYLLISRERGTRLHRGPPREAPELVRREGEHGRAFYCDFQGKE